MSVKSRIVAGIDLAGVETRPTGLCFLKNCFTTLEIIHFDSEIIKRILEKKPLVVAIDAPLSLPREDPSASFRECDRAVRRMGIRILPLSLSGMRKLTLRGIRIREWLEILGFTVIETYPRAALELLGFSARRGEYLRKIIVEKFGLKGDVNRELSVHELDALVCALVARLYLEEKTIAVGDPYEMLIVLPCSQCLE
ncbi:MAG: DUF429 domain-containing protein [Thermoprotei archaeon]|nr:MAG: DUF429 domain-containing protein [Thermoprotei archaeon]